MRTRRFAAFALLAGSLGFAAIAGRSANAEDNGPGGIVEEVRYSEANGRILEHRVLIDSSVVADTSALADAVTGVSAGSSTVTAQYALNSWRWPATAMPVRVFYNPSGATGVPSAEPWIQAAIGQWSVVTTGFRFNYAGVTSADVGACGGGEGNPDGINTIAYVHGMERGVLGQTCTLSTNSGKLVEFDMQLNAEAAWGADTPIAASQYDLPSTVLHEMGHAAALGHPCPLGRTGECTAAEQVSVMYPSIGRGQMKRNLQPDDIAGLKAQYPSGSIPPTPVPTQAPTPVPSPTPTRSPNYNRNFEYFTAAVAHD